jgi:hypothetical protein
MSAGGNALSREWLNEHQRSFALWERATAQGWRAEENPHYPYLARYRVRDHVIVEFPREDLDAFEAALDADRKYFHEAEAAQWTGA